MYQQGAPLTADLSVAVYLYQPGDGGLDRVAILLANHLLRRGGRVELWMARTDGRASSVLSAGPKVSGIALDGRFSLPPFVPEDGAMARLVDMQRVPSFR